MKKLGILLFVAVATLVLASCEQSKQIEPAVADQIQTITASRAGFSTRSHLEPATITYYGDEYEWYGVFWDAPDKIDVAYPGGTPATFKSTNTAPAETATFKGKLPEANGDILYGLYPAQDGMSVDADGYITVPFHDKQTAVAGSYDPVAFPAVAMSESKNLDFLNVCGLLRFNLIDEGIDEIVLRPREEPLPGGDLEVQIVEEFLRSPSAVQPKPVNKPNRNLPKTRGDGDYEYEPIEVDESGYITVEIYDAEPIEEISLKAPSGSVLKPGTEYFMSVPPCNYYYTGAEILLKTGGETVKSFVKFGYVNRSCIHPVALGFASEEFEGAGYYYNESSGGYNIVFFETMPEELVYDVMPEGNWLSVDIGDSFVSGTYDLTSNLDGSNWSFYVTYNGAFIDYFNSGTITIVLDKEKGTIEFEIDGVAYDGTIVKSSYSGPIVQSDDYIFAW